MRYFQDKNISWRRSNWFRTASAFEWYAPEDLDVLRLKVRSEFFGKLFSQLQKGISFHSGTHYQNLILFLAITQ